MKTKVTFTLPAGSIIGADKCVLLGEFNDWNLEEGIYLQKQADGSMRAEVELMAGETYLYRYLLSDGRWINDDGEKIISEVSGFPVENCVIRVPEISKTETLRSAKTVPKKKVSKPKPKVKVVKDDLTKVEGIGKKIEALLYKNDINSYKQLSKTTLKSLKGILASGGNKFSIHNPGSWPKQAKLAAEAKLDDFELLQKQLKGGKY